MFGSWSFFELRGKTREYFTKYARIEPEYWLHHLARMDPQALNTLETFRQHAGLEKFEEIELWRTGEVAARMHFDGFMAYVTKHLPPRVRRGSGSYSYLNDPGTVYWLELEHGVRVEASGSLYAWTCLPQYQEKRDDPEAPEFVLINKTSP